MGKRKIIQKSVFSIILWLFIDAFYFCHINVLIFLYFYFVIYFLVPGIEEESTLPPSQNGTVTYDDLRRKNREEYINKNTRQYRLEFINSLIPLLGYYKKGKHLLFIMVIII